MSSPGGGTADTLVRQTLHVPVSDGQNAWKPVANGNAWRRIPFSAASCSHCTRDDAQVRTHTEVVCAVAVRGVHWGSNWRPHLDDVVLRVQLRHEREAASLLLSIRALLLEPVEDFLRRPFVLPVFLRTCRGTRQQRVKRTTLCPAYAFVAGWKGTL